MDWYAAFVCYDFHLYGDDAGSKHMESFSGFTGDIYDKVAFCRAAIVDSYKEVASIFQVGDAHDGSHGEATVGSGQVVFVVAFSIGCFFALEAVVIVGGFACRDDRPVSWPFGLC